MGTEICTRCGGADPLVTGRRECVAEPAPADSAVLWTVGLCRECGLKDLADDRRTSIRMAPLKGCLMALMGLGVCAVALISLTESGWEKLWAVAFAFLGIPATIKGVGYLVTLPVALRQLDATTEHLEAGALTERDRDLLVHLEAHRALHVLESGGGFVHGGLRLPHTHGADPKGITYSLRRLETEEGAQEKHEAP